MHHVSVSPVKSYWASADAVAGSVAPLWASFLAGTSALPLPAGSVSAGLSCSTLALDLGLPSFSLDTASQARFPAQQALSFFSSTLLNVNDWF